MSDTDETMETMSTKLRELELDHVQIAGRIMQLREDMALYQNGPRRRPGRPRNASALNPYPSPILQQGTARSNIVPQRVEGGAATASVDEGEAA